MYWIFALVFPAPCTQHTGHLQELADLPEQGRSM